MAVVDAGARRSVGLQPVGIPAAAQRPGGPVPGDGRPAVESKFLAVGEQRLWVRGVTYGTFAPGYEGERFPAPDQVELDFAAMAFHGVNAVRVYTTPPRWLLDMAAAAGLWVIVGLAWEQHVAFLGSRPQRASIVGGVAEAVASCAGHPAVLCYAVGNEIPASIVRWHGRAPVERFLDDLCAAARSVDEQALVTYVNFPSTEYLCVPSADLVAFNVYLKDADDLGAYLARLHNLAGDRPLLVAELGLDSLRNGAARQADAVGRQIDVTFDGGCAGVCVFAWTDEWHRGDHAILDWDFGLTDRDRNDKPALKRVRAAFSERVPQEPTDAVSISVVVCTHNGAATLPECLDGALALDYPNFEVILIDDGSSDGSADLGRALGVRVISTPNRGLSAARNTGCRAAKGEIVAYLDDDARPDRHWLRYLAVTFAATNHVAVGGPNVPPLDETGVATCVANAPGGPAHVLVSDTEAEHLPGCNLAIRRDALMEVGGFDPQFRVAGDDVDICWRLRDRGWTLGYHPAAVVWHRRRPTVRRFCRQQRGYGRAEALLDRKWPERYSVPGNASWGGRLYGSGTAWLRRRSQIYYGRWGTAAFQQAVDRPGIGFAELAAAPEWYLVIAAFAALGLVGVCWAPLLAAFGPAGAAAGLSLAGALKGARAASFPRESHRRARRYRLRAMTLSLHLAQPAARLVGRLGHGLVPWRRPHRARFALPRPQHRELWSETWKPLEARLRQIATELRDCGSRVHVGAAHDRWDLQVSGGAFGSVRLRTAVEDHGGGRQLIRVRLWPRVGRLVPLLVLSLSGAGTAAALQHAAVASAVLLAVAATVAIAAIHECGIATSRMLDAVRGGPCQSQPGSDPRELR